MNTQEEIKKRVRLTGIDAVGYVLHTGGLGGLPPRIELSKAAVGFALQRTLREMAKNMPFEG